MMARIVNVKVLPVAVAVHGQFELVTRAALYFTHLAEGAIALL
jgi:hypothetical protein